MLMKGIARSVWCRSWKALVFGWFGLVVSSPIIGHIAGDDPKRLKTALLLLPCASVIMFVGSLAL